MKKSFYYQFKKVDSILFVLLLELIFVCFLGLACPALWVVFILTACVWGYKNFVKHAGVVITDQCIKVDYSNPIEWKDLQYAEIRTVRLCGKDKKILSLIPKEGIQYKYSFLQKNNADFGPFNSIIWDFFIFR